MEVNNGGFDQYFFNSTIDVNEAINSLCAIGALKTADIAKKAFSIFGDRVPTDRFVRQGILKTLMTNDAEQLLQKCNDSFYKYEDDLAELQYKFILEHKLHFF